MLTTRIVFWNLGQLSSEGSTLRYRESIEALRQLASDVDTHIIALVEITDDSTLQDLAQNLGRPWLALSTTHNPKGLNIGILYDDSLYKPTSIPIGAPAYPLNGRRVLSGRQTACLFRMEAKEHRAFRLAIVHFKAEDGEAAHYINSVLGEWLQQILETQNKDEPMPVVIGGDFNCEPFDPIFGPGGLAAYRRADMATRAPGTLKLYNPMWRLLTDPTPLADLRNRISADDRTLRSTVPAGTLDASKLIDGVIVSSDWLVDPHFEFIENRLNVMTDPKWHHIGERGAHHAGKKDSTKDERISDHLPVAVYLNIS